MIALIRNVVDLPGIVKTNPTNCMNKDASNGPTDFRPQNREKGASMEERHGKDEGGNPQKAPVLGATQKRSDRPFLK